MRPNFWENFLQNSLRILGQFARILLEKSKLGQNCANSTRENSTQTNESKTKLAQMMAQKRQESAPTESLGPPLVLRSFRPRGKQNSAKSGESGEAGNGSESIMRAEVSAIKLHNQSNLLFLLSDSSALGASQSKSQSSGVQKQKQKQQVSTFAANGNLRIEIQIRTRFWIFSQFHPKIVSSVGAK